MLYVKNITTQSYIPTKEEFLLNLHNKYDYQPIDSTLLNNLKLDLELYHKLYGEALTFNKINNKIIITYTKPALNYLGVELDNTTEHELMSDNEFGFDVIIKSNLDNSWLGKEELFNNITNVHYLYESPFEQIALESDIHLTGYTKELKHIKEIVIMNATKLSDNI